MCNVVCPLPELTTVFTKVDVSDNVGVRIKGKKKKK